MNPLEARVAFFRELSANPWQNKFNWTLDVIKMYSSESRYVLQKQGSVFQF